MSKYSFCALFQRLDDRGCGCTYCHLQEASMSWRETCRDPMIWWDRLRWSCGTSSPSTSFPWSYRWHHSPAKKPNISFFFFYYFFDSRNNEEISIMQLFLSFLILFVSDSSTYWKVQIFCSAVSISVRFKFLKLSAIHFANGRNYAFVRRVIEMNRTSF